MRWVAVVAGSGVVLAIGRCPTPLLLSLVAGWVCISYNWLLLKISTFVMGFLLGLY